MGVLFVFDDGDEKFMPGRVNPHISATGPVIENYDRVFLVFIVCSSLTHSFPEE